MWVSNLGTVAGRRPSDRHRFTTAVSRKASQISRYVAPRQAGSTSLRQEGFGDSDGDDLENRHLVIL